MFMHRNGCVSMAAPWTRTEGVAETGAPLWEPTCDVAGKCKPSAENIFQKDSQPRGRSGPPTQQNSRQLLLYKVTLPTPTLSPPLPAGPAEAGIYFLLHHSH